MDYQKIALIIEKNQCLRHKAHPIANPIGNSIELRCCCISFEEELRKQIVIEKEKQNLENIRNFLHGIKV